MDFQKRPIFLCFSSNIFQSRVTYHTTQCQEELSRFSSKANSGESHLYSFSMTECSSDQSILLMSVISLQDPSFAAFLLDKLQALEWPPRGRHAGSSCEVCGTPLHHLRRLALQKALELARDMPDPQPGPFSGFPPRSAAQSVVTLPSTQQASRDWSIQSAHARSSAKLYGVPLAGDKQRDEGWVPSGVSGGTQPLCLAKVTPLPVHAQHYLEGVWSVHRVSRSSHHHFAQVSHTQFSSPQSCSPQVNSVLLN